MDEGAKQIVELLEQRSLPVAVRGYDRAATDELLEQAEEGLKAILREHGDALTRVHDLERKIAEGQQREDAVTEAMLLATKIRADSEREGKELRAKSVLAAEAITKEAQRRADEILEEAETQAQSIVSDAHNKASVLDQGVHDREEPSERIRARLRDFLQSMLAEVERRNQESVSIVGDLLGRAGQAAEAEKEVAASQAGHDDGGVRERGTEFRGSETGPGGFDTSATK